MNVTGVALVGAALAIFPACKQVPDGSSGEEESSMSPGEVDDALIAAIQAERYRDAYNLMTTPYRDSVPFEEFERAVAANAYLKNSTQIGCRRMTTYEGAVHVRQCIMESKVGMIHAELFYARDQGEWKMTGILLGGTPALPGPRGNPPPAQSP